MLQSIKAALLWAAVTDVAAGRVVSGAEAGEVPARLGRFVPPFLRMPDTSAFQVHPSRLGGLGRTSTYRPSERLWRAPAAVASSSGLTLERAPPAPPPAPPRGGGGGGGGGPVEYLRELDPEETEEVLRNWISQARAQRAMDRAFEPSDLVPVYTRAVQEMEDLRDLQVGDNDVRKVVMGFFLPQADGGLKLRSIVGGKVTKFPAGSKWAMDVLSVTNLLVDPTELTDAKSDAAAKLYQGIDKVQDVVQSSVMLEGVDKRMGGYEPICIEQGIKHGFIAEPQDPAKLTEADLRAEARQAEEERRAFFAAVEERKGEVADLMEQIRAEAPAASAAPAWTSYTTLPGALEAAVAAEDFARAAQLKKALARCGRLDAAAELAETAARLEAALAEEDFPLAAALKVELEGAAQEALEE